MAILVAGVMNMEETAVQEMPYFCPNCRSNRVKFSVIKTYSQSLIKDAVTGTVSQMNEPEPVHDAEPNIKCQVCGFVGNELRFIKQAEREPRTASSVNPSYQ